MVINKFIEKIYKFIYFFNKRVFTTFKSKLSSPDYLTLVATLQSPDYLTQVATLHSPDYLTLVATLQRIPSTYSKSRGLAGESKSTLQSQLM